MKQLCYLVLLAILASNCTSTLVYSPSLNLPNQPLRQNEIDVQGGLEMLPESRPDQDTTSTTLGVHSMISYGFGDNFNLSLKGWVDIGNESKNPRPGLSLTGQFIKHRSPESRFIITPRVGIANFGDGYGLSSSVIYQKDQSPKFSWYSGLGVGWGFSDLEKVSYNSNVAPRYPFGYMAMIHLGLGYQLPSNFRLNVELNPIYQLSTFDESSHLLVSPSIGIGYVFRSESEN